MAVVSALFMIFFISLDGLIWGWLIGYRRYYFPMIHFLLLSIGTGLILWLFYQIGVMLDDVIPFHIFNKLSGVFLLILSVYHLIDGEGVFKRAVALKLFLIINIDNIGISLLAGFDAIGRFFPVIAGIQFAAFFLIGLFLAYNTSSYALQQYRHILPSLILFSMGFFKLVFG